MTQINKKNVFYLVDWEWKISRVNGIERVVRWNTGAWTERRFGSNRSVERRWIVRRALSCTARVRQTKTKRARERTSKYHVTDISTPLRRKLFLWWNRTTLRNNDIHIWCGLFQSFMFSFVVCLRVFARVIAVQFKFTAFVCIAEWLMISVSIWMHMRIYNTSFLNCTACDLSHSMRLLHFQLTAVVLHL